MALSDNVKSDLAHKVRMAYATLERKNATASEKAVARSTIAEWLDILRGSK